MDTPEQIPVHKDEYDSYDLEVPEPSPIQPIQEEYAPVIFVQDTVAHVVSIDMLSGKVHSLEDGPAHSVWRTIGVTVNIIQSTEKMKIIVDCLNYDGIIVNSLEARGVISCLSQEPFKSVPLIWTIHERTLATRLTIHVKWPD